MGAPFGRSMSPRLPTPISATQQPAGTNMPLEAVVGRKGSDSPMSPHMIVPSAFPPHAALPPAVQFATARKRSVSKAAISNPTFVSGTYTVSTVALPPGASLDNGRASPASAGGYFSPRGGGGPAPAGEARSLSRQGGMASPPPPLPPMNPRRKQNGFSAGMGSIRDAMSRSRGKADGSASSSPEGSRERAIMSPGPADNFAGRLRKQASEGSSLIGRARRDVVGLPGMPGAMPVTPLESR